HFQTTTNIILLSMAVSDLLVGLAMMPLMIITLDFCWHFQTTTNLILLSMAVSDLLVGLAVMPLMIATLDSCRDALSCHVAGSHFSGTRVKGSQLAVEFSGVAELNAARS
ncbi:hypothetical protein D4764_0245160, partial [Takifugu flavidus]